MPESEVPVSVHPQLELDAPISPRWKSGTRWHWSNIALMASMHALALLAVVPMFFHWSVLVVLIVTFYISGGLGVCLGFHRLLTHRSYRTSKPIEYALTVLGSLSYQGSPMEWVGTHRIHHAESDGPGDPHSPRHGFTWSHMLWCFYRHPDGLNPRDFVRDMQRDSGHRIIDRCFFVPQILLGLVLFILGWLVVGTWQAGAGWTIWGLGVRTALLYHVTWFVNSAAHTWGYRNFETDDGSRNNWWVALLSFGEGWHNNHHAQPRSAAHGMYWWELDPTYWAIRVMEKLGIAERVVRPSLPNQSPPREESAASD